MPCPIVAITSAPIPIVSISDTYFTNPRGSAPNQILTKLNSTVRGLDFVIQGLSVVASGSTLAQQANDDGTTLWRIAAGPARSFYAAVTNRWQVIIEEVDGILINSYYPDGGLSSAQAAMTFTAGSLRVFNPVLLPTGLPESHPHSGKTLDFLR